MREAPAPDGRPGFARIDSVHQDDFEGIKGLYHINAVDCVAQWEIGASVHTIAESHLVPVIEQMLEQLPFEILGFHADNGSTYVHRRGTQMLDELRIVFTRSRPRRSNDNGLAETKNGAVMRRVFGYPHIPQRHAARINTFCLEYLEPFLSFHHPWLFATELSESKKPGRIKRVYRAGSAMTPLDELASLPEAYRFLRAGVTLEPLQQPARASERRAGRRGAKRGPCRAVSVGACARVTSRKVIGARDAGATRPPGNGQVDDAPAAHHAPSVDNAGALPTARTLRSLAHSPPPQRTSPGQYTANTHNRSTRPAPPIPGRSRLKPCLETTLSATSTGPASIPTTATGLVRAGSAQQDERARLGLVGIQDLFQEG